MFNVIILGLARFLADVSTEMVYPLLPFFLNSIAIGATPTLIGLIEGLAESAARLIRVYSDAWSDRLPECKPMTLLGYAAGSIGKMLLFLATGWTLVLAARVTDRLGEGIRTAPHEALDADSAAHAPRKRASGLRWVLDHAGASLGVILGYVLYSSWQDFSSAVWLFAIVPAVLSVFVISLVREGHVHGAARRKAPAPWWHSEGRGFVKSWQGLDARVKAFLLIILIFALGNSSNLFLLLRARDQGIDPTVVILMYLVFNFVCAVAAWPAGRLAGRMGPRSLLFVGYLTYAVVYFGFAVANPLQLWGLFATYGLYVALTGGMETALATEIAPIEQRTMAIGLGATFAGVGVLPASLMAGLLWDSVGPAAPFYLGGALSGLAALALWRFV